MSKKQAWAIRHVNFENLGSLEPVLKQHGYEINYLEAGVDNLNILKAEGTGQKAVDLLIVLGAPIGANDESDYPYIKDELDLLKIRLQNKLATLGICLGAQLMAKALGAKVYKGPVAEIGWAPISLSPDGAKSCLKAFGDQQLRVLHWHQDTFNLPEQAVRLASTTHFPNQAFSVGNHALALQFHLEAEGSKFEQWLVGHACEISQCKVSSVKKLREDAHEYSGALAKNASLVWDAWLKNIA